MGTSFVFLSTISSQIKCANKKSTYTICLKPEEKFILWNDELSANLSASIDIYMITLMVWVDTTVM